MVFIVIFLKIVFIGQMRKIRNLNFFYNWKFMQGDDTQQQLNTNFDDKPIGKGQNIPELSEYPPDFNPNDIPVDTKPQPLPLPKRLQSKVWKIRKQALQQLLLQVNENSSAYQEVESLTLSLITDANQQCQEKALKIFLKYLESSMKMSLQPKPIIKNLIEKCLIIEKLDIPNLTVQIMFWMMDSFEEILLNQVNEALLHKNPKICASVFGFMEKLINNYGAKKLGCLQRFAKHFTLLANNVRPVAKNKTIDMFKEAYKWMGDHVYELNMHPEVKEEVSKFSKTYEKQPMQVKRGLTEEQKKNKKLVMESMDDDEDDQTPVDALIPYDGKWVDTVLALQKWKQKKQILDQFIKKTKVSQIVPRQNSQYITLIKRLMVDKNINLLACGFKIVKNLCKGLKKNFTHPCKAIQSYVFLKLKDTKSSVVQQTQQTLKAMMYCLSIQDFQEEIKDGLHDKSSNMRIQTLKFIKNMMVSRKDKKLMGVLKNFTSIFCEMNQDGASDVRELVLEVLCKIKAMYGMHFFGDKLRSLPPKKYQTIQNYIDPNQKQQDTKSDVQEMIPSKPPPAPQKVVKKPIVVHPNKQNIKQRINHIQVQPIHKVPSATKYSDYESPSQNVRNNAYQNLLLKDGSTIQNQFFEDFKNSKFALIRESSPHILKTLINLVKKAITSVKNSIHMEHAEFLLYHDWKKCKNALTQFFSNTRFQLPALEYTKNRGFFTSKREIAEVCPQPPFSFKSFYLSLHQLLPKMSSPHEDLKMEAANSAIEIIRTITISLSYENPQHSSSETFSQFCNVLRFRIQDSNELVANKYIQVVTELLNKGLLIKGKGCGKQIVTMLIKRLNDRRFPNLELFVREMVMNHSQFFWQILAMQVCKQNTCETVLQIIKQYNESFFKSADQKSYIIPLLSCISKDIQTYKVIQLLDQIVEINGQKALQKAIKECQLPNLEEYAKKWDIYIDNHRENQNHYFNQGNRHGGENKLDRINSEIDDAWPLVPSSSHILKLIQNFLKRGEPFSTLVTPLYLQEKQIATLNEISVQVLESHSDLFIKWIFWRFNLDKEKRVIEALAKLTKRILKSNFQLHESEIVILLGALSSCLIMHKKQFIDIICDINRLISQTMYRDKAIRYWINSLSETNAPSEQILEMMVKSYEKSQISNEMVSLARIPAVVANEAFNKYLRANFNDKVLSVYGFKLQDLKKSPNINLKSANLMASIPAEEAKFYKQFFQKVSSNEVVDKIIQHIGQRQPTQTHIKIMNSIIMPYLNRELSFINVYNYFKYLQEMVQKMNFSSVLLSLVRTLTFFLIDLDEIKLQNNGQMLKTINKIILILLEVSEPKHILEVLFAILREQLRSKEQSKLNLILPKCVSKVIKAPQFKNNFERNPICKECLIYIINEIKHIVTAYNIRQELPILNNLKNMLNEVINNFPQIKPYFKEVMDNLDLNDGVCHALFTHVLSETNLTPVRSPFSRPGQTIEAIKTLGNTTLMQKRQLQ